MRNRTGAAFAAGCLFMLACAAVYLGLFIWYANTVIPHTTPTGYTNFWWGLLHGVFAGPTFIYSLFTHGITIYQAPNSGGWYNFGFLLGVGSMVSVSVSARTSRSR